MTYENQSKPDALTPTTKPKSELNPFAGTISDAWTPQAKPIERLSPADAAAEAAKEHARAAVPTKVAQVTDDGSTNFTSVGGPDSKPIERLSPADAAAQEARDRDRAGEGTQYIQQSSDSKGTNSIIDGVPYDKAGGAALDHLVHGSSGMVINDNVSLTRTPEQLNNVRTVLTDAHAADGDKLRAAAVLASNGESAVKTTTGGEYRFAKSADGTVTLSFRDSAAGAVKTLSGKVSDDAQLLTPQGGAPRDAVPGAAPQGEQQPKKPEDKLFDPTLSAEERLKVAQDIAHNGQRRFKGPDGKNYEISTAKYGDRESVVVHMGDGHGHTYPILRGIVEKDGSVAHQKDNRGKEVDYSSDWVKKNLADNPLLRHEPKHEEQRRAEGDRPPETDEQKRVHDARERLTKDAHEKITNEDEQKRFLENMNKFEQRAKEQGVPEKQVSDTYDQMSRMLEAQNAKVAQADRVLAAETFIYHAADPKTIDQGNHGTCNVTTVGKREMFINPSAGAEMVATATIDGQWTSPDGRTVKLDGDSLNPGTEEAKGMPPTDPNRTYATQLMNLVVANDITQRRMPPEFYTQERVSGQDDDTGERVRMADGRVVWKNQPGIGCPELQREATRFDGQEGTVIANRERDNRPPIVSVSSRDELAQRLDALQTDKKLPVVIMVDANDPIFNGTGDPKTAGKMHVVLINGYDKATGKVQILNQWGRFNDQVVSLDDLYRSTGRPQPVPAAVPVPRAA